MLRIRIRLLTRNKTGGTMWVLGVHSAHDWQDGKHEDQTVCFQIKRTLTPTKAQLIITNLESDFQTCQGLESVVACLSVLNNWFCFHSIGKKEVIGQLGGKLPFPQNSLKVDPVKVHPLTHLLPIQIWHHFAIFLSDSMVDSFFPQKSLCSSYCNTLVGEVGKWVSASGLASPSMPLFSH